MVALLALGSALAAPLAADLPVQRLGPHQQQVRELGRLVKPGVPRVPARTPLPPPSPGPDMTVYGYLAYWEAELTTVAWDDITHIAIFSAGANSDGTLYDTEKWDIADEAVALADPYGVKVHLCVTNFDSDSLRTLLGSSSNRNTLIDEISGWVASTGADGANIDFEQFPSDRRAEMVTFVTDLEAAVGEVVLATPSVDWSDGWDEAALSQHADLFIMGYGYHWGGSSYAGPTDPLYAGGGTVWDGVQSYSLSRTVESYVADGADPSRVILGLPLYGMGWPTGSNGVPAATLDYGYSVYFSSAWADEGAFGRNEETTSASLYQYDGNDQIWYGDTETVRQRIAYVRDETALGGVGFWALHYDGDDAGFWQMVRDETTWMEEPPGTGPGDTGTTPSGDLLADAGAPFLAYPGDTVILSGEGSTGPAGAALQYRWTQVEGPAVSLDDRQSATPSFVIEGPGNLVFELEVGDGSDWSAPARSYVVVVDPDVARRHEARGCGCDGAGSGATGALALLLALAGLRRR